MSNQKTKAVLLAAGLGTRLRPITNEIPKCLISINQRPLIDYWFGALRRADIRDVLINTHHLPAQVRDYLRNLQAHERWNIAEKYEPKLLGSAGTIHKNRAWMDDGDTCVIIYADNLSTLDLGEVIAFHRSHDDPFTTVLFRTHRPEACGIAELDTNGRIVGFIEKPKRPKSDLANAGVYVMNAEAYREIADRNRFDLGFDVLPAFINRMHGYCFEGYHRDIGDIDSLEQARIDAPKVFEATG